MPWLASPVSFDRVRFSLALLAEMSETSDAGRCAEEVLSLIRKDLKKTHTNKKIVS